MNNDMPVWLLPTVRKEKCYSGLSYPVGAEIISAALAGIPQYDELLLDFYIGVQEVSLPRYVMLVDYTPYGQSFNTACRWRLAIHAVSSPLKAPLRQALAEDGFPHIRKWLAEPRPPLWFAALKWLSITFDPERRILLYKEEGRL